jgi:hypothetical protein
MPQPPPNDLPRIEDLPPPALLRRSRNARQRCCPWCGRPAPRCGLGRRIIHDLGDAGRGQPVSLVVTYSKHRCKVCRRIFNTDLSDLAAPKSRYSHRVRLMAVHLVLEERLAFRAASAQLWRDHCVLVPWATIQNWTEAEREKRRAAGRSRKAGS